MIDLNELNEEFKVDIDSVTSWCNEIYLDQFDEFFVDYRVLFKRLKSKEKSITDEELARILIDLPIQLFGIAEALNKFKISQEVVKLKNRQRELELIRNSLKSTVTDRKQDATDKMIEYKLLITAYSSIIDRVTSEISFCRELIMGAKKIHDSRLAGIRSNPVSEVDETMLPDYVVTD